MNLPADLQAEALESLMESGQVKVERIVSKGHVSPDRFWYDQAHSEWVLVLQGAAIIQVEKDEGNKDYHLEPGDFLNLPAHIRHRVAWTTPDTETIWLAIHYPTGD